MKYIVDLIICNNIYRKDEKILKNLLIAQSGGPTPAINSTLAGILTEAYLNSESIDKIYGATNGIEGILSETFIEISSIIKNTESIELLKNTPAAVLGSCRYKLKDTSEDDEKIKKIINTFQKYNIGYFIYIGGNDSMDTVDKISKYCMKNNINEIKVVGAPKTIDNDLDKIDHCPGFGSAAKYVATTFSEIERDINVYKADSVVIVEVMGRNAGWLTAASALSNLSGGNGPDLIYLCEATFNTDNFIKDVREVLERKSNVLIAISEGIKSDDGKYISEGVQSNHVDSFGHKYISGAAKVLEDVVRNEIGCKVRSIELNLMQRCSSHILSRTDIEESRLLGMKACQCAIHGFTGVMSTIIRKSDEPYEIKLGSIPVSEIANKEKSVPRAWINSKGNGIEKAMIAYLTPLIQGEVHIEYNKGIPKHLILL